jgi:hypothetical protein
MDSSAASIVGSKDQPASIHTDPGPKKTYGFVIAIIVGVIGVIGLGVGGAGVAGYFHVGALSNMAQVDAIIMMSAGGVGAILFIGGIVGTVISLKNRRQVLDSARLDELTHGGLVYGPDIWPELGRKWGHTLKVLDQNIPEAPTEGLQDGKIRLYIPQSIAVDGDGEDFALSTLVSITGAEHGIAICDLVEEFGTIRGQGKWIEIDSDMIPNSIGKDRATHEDMVKEQGCRIPSVLEAMMVNLMVFAITGERLYHSHQTLCSEVSSNGEPTVVGNFNELGLYAHRGFRDNNHRRGVVGVRELGANDDD